MADVAKKMYEGQPGTTDTLLYTAPATGAVVRNIHVTNTTGSEATITVGLNTGAAIIGAEHFMSAHPVRGNRQLDWSGFAVLDANETIRGLQGTASALTVTISGVEL